MNLVVQEHYCYGKPTGSVVVVDDDTGQTVMQFRRRRNERRRAVMQRALAWVDSGAKGTPGTAPSRPLAGSDYRREVHDDYDSAVAEEASR